MLEVKDFGVAVPEMTIKLSSLTWNGKLMKLSMLKQIALEDLVLFKPKAPQLAGRPLGWINHAWEKDGSSPWPDLKTFYHILWLKEGQLRRCALKLEGSTMAKLFHHVVTEPEVKGAFERRMPWTKRKWSFCLPR